MAGSRAARWIGASTVAVLLLAGCGDDDAPVSTEDATSSTTAVDDPAPDDPDTDDAPAVAPLDLQLRPVLRMLPPGGDAGGGSGEGCATADGGWVTGPTVLAPQVEDGQEAACHELGPARVSGDDVESATAVESGLGQWGVALVLTEEGIARLNELTGECFEAAPTCPTRQLAIVVDRAVLSAPAVNEPTFERGAISITGRFTQAEAEALAAGLR